MFNLKHQKAKCLEKLIEHFDRFALVANDENRSKAVREVAAQQCSKIADDLSIGLAQLDAME